MMKKDLKIIGKPMTKLDAGLRATGQAVYGHDIKLPGMLYGAILRTKYLSAVIESIDVSEALKLEGVKCIITADDINVNNISHKRDHPVLKKGEVNCIRDEIAAVAAVSKETAKQALRLIKVKYKERKGIFDPFEALKEETVQINKFSDGKQSNKNIAQEFHYEHGDIEAQKKKSDVVVTRRYTLPRVTHCCLATCNITADYSLVTRRLTLYSSTQVPFLYQRDLAHALKIEPSRIRIIQPVIGGGFGSKLDMYPFEPICCLLSMKTGAPVQLLFDREEEFIASPTRQPMFIDLTTGADKNGNFTFREVKITMDNGAYTSWGATTPFVMMQTFSSLYKVPACSFDAQAVYTNNIYAGSMRGYGNPQATFSLERNIDIMADKLGIDRVEIRLLNANFKGEVTGQGLEFKTCGHRQCLEAVIKESGYNTEQESPKPQITHSVMAPEALIPNIKSQSPNPKIKGKSDNRYKYGIGFASMLHVGGGAKIYRSDGCGTTIKIDDYGHIVIITGSNEIGQGSETILAMIVCQELGISMDRIKVINTDTDVKPWDVGVHASRTSFVAGNSLLGAVQKLKTKISQYAANILETAVENLAYENNGITDIKSGKTILLEKVVRNIHFTAPNELCTESFFYEPESRFQDKHFMGNVSGNYAFASQAVKVEVDTYTGNVKILDVYVAQDVGKVLNPLGLKGQIDGGVIMGLGYAISEELVVENGYVLNPSFHNYKLLTAGDIPEIHFFPVETEDEAGPYGAKGVGEAPLIPTAAATANAICNALGIEINELPMNPERVMRYWVK
ncbi:MAG: xanthine dehydrogenase family protein molybdopterin-binding subunit [Bacteroidia bacterium]|nr:xanthine dehydrogenase family protein molybdopterin-binding subunit [Bacteroidia bacterium]